MKTQTQYSLSQATEVVHGYAHATGKDLSHELGKLKPGVTLDKFVTNIYERDWTNVCPYGLLGAVGQNDTFVFVYCDGTTSKKIYQVAKVFGGFSSIRDADMPAEFYGVQDFEEVFKHNAKIRKVFE